MKLHYLFLSLTFSFPLAAFGGEKLSGTPIGTSEGIQYTSNGASSYIVYDIQGYAFDGNLDTYFATNQRSYTWVGLDLETPHVIDRVGWSPRNDGVGPHRMCLGVIQGANSDDWLDAVPLYIITEDGVIGQMSYADVSVNKGFRYVRFVGTGDSRCNIAELEFYGTPGDGETKNTQLFQVTNLPTVCINTLDAVEPYDKEHDITCNIIIINDNQAYVDKSGTIRERGNGSRTFPKKPWRIKFDKKQQVLPDAPAKAKKWTLINNYGDKTLLRNILAFEIAKRLNMKFVPYAHAVDVILNGEYKGCYQLCDQVEVNDGRLEITEMETTDIEGDALTGGYLVEVDAYANQEPAGEWFLSAHHSIPVTIKSPDDGGTPEQYNYIKNYFDDLEKRVFSYSNYTNRDDYREIFDIDSFLQHFIVGELSGNTDTYWSTYMYKERGDEKFYTGPVWDFDLAFENDIRTYPINSANGFLYYTSKSSAANNMKDFVRRIIQYDSRTKSDLTRVWSIARNDHSLTYGSLCSFIDKKADELQESQKLNFLRWPIMNQAVHQNPVVEGSYDKEVDRVKNYLKERFSKLDDLMNYDAILSEINNIDSVEDSVMPTITNGSVSLAGNIAFSIYSISGVQIFQGIGTSPQLPAGIYIIKTTTDTYKIVL